MHSMVPSRPAPVFTIGREAMFDFWKLLSQLVPLAYHIFKVIIIVIELIDDFSDPPY